MTNLSPSRKAVRDGGRYHDGSDGLDMPFAVALEDMILVGVIQAVWNLLLYFESHPPVALSVVHSNVLA